jgi:hypothetical protein
MQQPMPAAFGLYPSTRALHFGAEALRSARFRQTDISVMYSDGVQALRLRERVEQADVADDDEPESIGVVLSGLSGIGAVSLPDAGPYVCGGPVLATLVNRGSGLVSALRGLGVPQTAVARFEERLRTGGLLLTVQCESEEWADRACLILEATGAEHVAAADADAAGGGLRAAS